MNSEDNSFLEMAFRDIVVERGLQLNSLVQKHGVPNNYNIIKLGNYNRPKQICFRNEVFRIVSGGVNEFLDYFGIIFKREISRWLMNEFAFQQPDNGYSEHNWYYFNQLFTSEPFINHLKLEDLKHEIIRSKKIPFEIKEALDTGKLHKSKMKSFVYKDFDHALLGLYAKFSSNGSGLYFTDHDFFSRVSYQDEKEELLSEIPSESRADPGKRSDLVEVLKETDFRIMAIEEDPREAYNLTYWVPIGTAHGFLSDHGWSLDQISELLVSKKTLGFSFDRDKGDYVDLPDKDMTLFYLPALERAVTGKAD